MLRVIPIVGKCKAKFNGEVCAGEEKDAARRLTLQPDFSVLFPAGIVAAVCFADMLEFSGRSNAWITGNRLENQPGRCSAGGGAGLSRPQRGRAGDIPRAN